MTGPSRARVVAVARNWIGTPYRHQASVRGAGCDCLGLLRGVWREVIGAEPEVLPAYTAGWGETSGDEVLFAAAMRHLRPSSGTPQPGDVLLFRMRERSIAKHLGIVGDPATAFIHAYSHHGVVESALSEPWRRRLAAVFEFPFERI